VRARSGFGGWRTILRLDEPQLWPASALLCEAILGREIAAVL
jgi:hypothetical protein